MTADPALDRQRRVGEREAQLVGRLERAGEAEEVVLDLGEPALGARDLEQRLRVRLDLGRSSSRLRLPRRSDRRSSLPFPTELM